MGDLDNDELAANLKRLIESKSLLKTVVLHLAG
jgi:hypothetical protein